MVRSDRPVRSATSPIYVEGTVREEISSAREFHRSGLSEAEWMERSSPYIDQLVNSGEYPIFTRIVMEARPPHLSREDQFRDGLQRVLDCIAAALPSTAESAMSAPPKGQEVQDGPGQARRQRPERGSGTAPRGREGLSGGAVWRHFV
jgi:hypothetical protein